MQEVDDMFDGDQSLADIPMDEEFFNDGTDGLMDVDQTLVDDLLDGEIEGPPADANYEDDEGDDDEDEDDQPHPSVGEGSTAQWSEETIQTDGMSRLGICVNTTAKVVVCLKCALVVKPSELPHHISKIHFPMTATSTFSQELINAYALHPDPIDSRPGSIITAIYGLELVDGYISCDTCGYACKAEWRIKRHVRTSDGCKAYRQRPVQTYRPTSKRMYFGVDLKREHTDELTGTSLDPLDYLKKKFAPIPFSNIPIKSPKTSRDANHFLSIEKWDRYVQGRTGAELVHTVREREPDLRREVRICMERFADKVVEKLGAVDHEPRAAMGDYTG